MSRLENSRVCSITTSSNSNRTNTAADNPIESTGGGSSYITSLVGKFQQHIPNTSEKRFNFATKSRREHVNGCVSQNPPPNTNANSDHSSTAHIAPLEIAPSSSSTPEEDIEVDNNRFVYINSPHFVKHLECGISNVELADSFPNEGSDLVLNTNTVDRYSANEEVETVYHEGGDEVFDSIASIGTSVIEDVDESFSSSTPQSTSDTFACSNQNLKPILKRKYLSSEKTSNSSTPSLLPPPILKKRDSLGDVTVFQTSVSFTVHENAKPLSILKNRQARASQSLDDNLTSSDSTLQSDDNQYHLKPILKKKSWSTEEKVTFGANSAQPVDNVKSILKSSEKSISSSTASLSLKHSLTDDSVSSFCSLPCSDNSSNQQISNSKASTLRSILKSSLKTKRSTSLSPCTSFDSLVDESDSDSVSSSSSKHQRGAFHKKTSLESDVYAAPLSFICKTPYHSTVDNGTATSIDVDNTKTCAESSSTAINVKPILKKDSLTDDDLIAGPIYNIPECSPSNRTPVALSVRSKTSETSEPRMESTPNVYRNTSLKARPKSCFVVSDEVALSTPESNKTTVHTPISDRMVLLKQNGEDWRKRIQKQEPEKEILSCDVQLRAKPDNKGGSIRNRLSSLMDSQNQWRNRQSVNDSKQFTVESKGRLHTTKSNPLSFDSPKVTLRDTPKRIGLRGCTLNEKALNSVSSKLNSVLRPDKSLLSASPVVKSKEDKQEIRLPTLDLSSENKEEPNEQESRSYPESSFDSFEYLLKPDDEETFGSFFAINSSTYDQILNQSCVHNTGNELLSLDSLQSDSSLLLCDKKKRRIPAPKRRQALNRNPVTSSANNGISTNSHNGQTPPQSPSSKLNGKNEFPSKTNSNFAISALAGLASTEDFKSVANKLRSPATSINTPNDTWRTHDLKNSFQCKMLIMVKGRPRAQIRLVEPVWKSLNINDSFILVTKDTVYAYIGRFSNIIERTKCIEVSELIRKRKDLCFRSSTNPLILIDASCDSTKLNLFDKMLPLLNELDITMVDHHKWEDLFDESKSAFDDDEYYEESIICTNMVYQVVMNDNDATLVPVEKYWGRSPKYELFQSDSSFVFDYGTEMYVWIGKNVSNLLRKKAVDAAKELWLKGYDYSGLDISPFGSRLPMKMDKRPDWSWFTRVNHNMEPILFKDKFSNWPAFTLTRSVKNRSPVVSKTQNNTDQEAKSAHSIVKKDLSAELNLFPVDAKSDMINKLPKPQNLILENVSLGRGAGDIIKDEDGLSVKIVSLEVQCFVIDDSGNKVELSVDDRNFLFSAESYYIRWKYRLTRISRNLKTGGESKHSEQHGGRDRLCYFVWQGKDARNTQRGATALNAIDKLREEGAFQISMEYGHEEPAFLRIFNGSLVIQLGKRNKVNDIVQYRMFSLKDALPNETFLVERECKIKNLRSRDSLIFINPQISKIVYIWHGDKSPPSKRKLIKQFLEENILKTKSKEFGFNELIDQYDIVEIEEGKETNGFLNIFLNLNSPTDSLPKRLSKSNLHREIYFTLMDDNRNYNFTPRLFQFITSTDNIFEAIEIYPSYLPPQQSNITVNYPFKQSDLYERAKNRPTFFLFDNNYEIYLWESKFPFFIPSNKNCSNEVNIRNGLKMIDIESEIKSESNMTAGFIPQLWQAERKCALETTLTYCHAKNLSEPPTAYVISAGLEPDSFCGLFPTWTYYDNVAQIHIEDGRKPCQQILVQEILAQIRDINTSTYNYEILKRRPLLEGINVLCLESYLDDAEFEQIFSMNRDEFYSLPTWKQKLIKQEKELF